MSRPPTDTADRLFDHALTLFATKGYAATSVREIIEAVGLSKPVLYYHFDNKSDLFAKLITRVHTEAYRQLEELCAGPESPTEKLQAILRGTFAFCAADWRIPRMMFAASFGLNEPDIASLLTRHADRRYQLIKSLVTEAITKKELRFRDPDATALAFCALMDYPVNLFTRQEKETSYLTPKLASALFQIFLEGSSVQTPE